VRGLIVALCCLAVLANCAGTEIIKVEPAPYIFDNVSVGPGSGLRNLLKEISSPCCFLAVRVKGGPIRKKKEDVERYAEARIRQTVREAGFNSIASSDLDKVLRILTIQKTDLFDKRTRDEVFTAIGKFRTAELVVLLDIVLSQSDLYNRPLVDFWHCDMVDLRVIHPAHNEHLLTCTMTGFETNEEVRYDKAIGYALGKLGEAFIAKVNELRGKP
jgi:hypothetical protein